MDHNSKAKQLQCMEIVGGNQAVSQAIQAPGLDAWVESRPHESDAGGDIHYFSMCGSGRVTRLAIADVMGHGEEASELAVWLRGLMRKHINLLDQRRFARQINQEFASREDSSGLNRFATVALMTYFAPTDHLILCNAGHPPPLWYSGRTKQWGWLEPESPDLGPSLRQETVRYLGRPVANLPLGVLEGTHYVQFAVKLSPRDIVFVYTDGLVEARNPSGVMLGQQGLLRLAQAGGIEGSPQALAQNLLDAVDTHRGALNHEDDLTVVAIRHTAEEAPPLSAGWLVRVLPRMIGLARV